MAMQQYIEQTLAPRIQGDGGWVEFGALERNRLTLIFRGECSKCLILHRCTEWIARKIESDLGQRVEVIPVRKRPFFWDVEG